MIDIHRRAAAAVGRAARAGSTARSRGFRNFGGVCTRGDLRLQCGDVGGRGSSGRGAGALAYVEHIIIERDFGIAAQVEHAAVFELHLHDGVRVGLDGFFGEHFVANLRLTRHAINADDFYVTRYDLDRAYARVTARCCAHVRLLLWLLSVIRQGA